MLEYVSHVLVGKSSFIDFFKPQGSKISSLYEVNDKYSNVENYAKFGIVGTSQLAFRDLPELFKKYVNGTSSVGVDYGCGAGRSTRFLRSLNLNPIGVDISEKMLQQATKIDQENGVSNGRYIKIESGKIPIADKICDYVFSSFVDLVLSKEDMVNVLKERHRVLKDNGVVIIATGSEYIHSPDMKWVSYTTDYPENQRLSSGCIAKLGIKDTNAEFLDYNWLDEDYRKFFKENGFEVVEKRNPLGKKEDSVQWGSELEYSPAAIYVLKKSGS